MGGESAINTCDSHNLIICLLQLKSAQLIGRLNAIQSLEATSNRSSN